MSSKPEHCENCKKETDVLGNRTIDGRFTRWLCRWCDPVNKTKSWGDYRAE